MRKIGVVNFQKPLLNEGSRQTFKLAAGVKKVETMFMVLNNIRQIQDLIHQTKNFDLMEVAIILNNNADFKFRVPVQFATLFSVKDFSQKDSFISPLPFDGFEIPSNSKVSENAEHTAVFEMDRNFKTIPDYNGVLNYLVRNNLNAELYYTYSQ